MAASLFSLFQSFFSASGPIMPTGQDLQNLAQLDFSSARGIVAKAGGGQASATQLTTTYNEVNTVASAADSVKLPAALAGLRVFVSNMGANSLQVYGQNNETISATNSVAQAASAVGVSQASGFGAWYICTTNGQWKQVLSA